MYSYEIEQIIKKKNYLISVREYLRILNTSPQINVVKYDCFNDNFLIETNDNYKFVFKIRYKGEKE